ncbi:hypothetical protein [Escherichia coli]|uniref:hypothetical protein n=1 Tax=Escherichia coli TaxID=562 RepID=UPI0020212A21|nr:hypothetical protein [Escherichia coli]
MKSFIFVLCFAFSAAVYAQEDSISVINSSADLACKNNPDAASKSHAKSCSFRRLLLLLKMQNFIQPFVAAMLRTKIKKNVMMPVS